MIYQSLGEHTNPRYIVENVVNQVVPLEPTGYVSLRHRRKMERRREEVRDSGYATLNWWTRRGRDLYTSQWGEGQYLDPDALYDDAIAFVLESLGIGWLGSFFVSWSIRIAVKLIVNWLLSADSMNYRQKIERNVSYGTH